MAGGLGLIPSWETKLYVIVKKKKKKKENTLSIEKLGTTVSRQEKTL